MFRRYRLIITLFHSIAAQLFLIFFFATVLPVLIGGAISYHQSKSIIEEQVSQIAALTVRQVKEKMNLIVRRVDDTTLTLLGNSTIQDALKGVDSNGLLTASQLNFEARKLLSDVMNYEMFDIYIFDVHRENNILTSDYSFSVDPWQTEWYEQIRKANGRPVWFGLSTTSKLNSRNVSLGYPVFSVGRAIKDLETGKMLGVMLIEIRGDVLTKELDSIQFGESGYVYLADARNRYMYHSDPSYYGKYVGVQLPQLPKEYLDDKRSHLILQEKLDNGWTVVGVVPVQELVADSKQIRDQTVMIVIISIVVAIAMGYYVSLNIGQPLVKLSRLMRLVEEGDLTVRAPVKGKNEIGYLSRSFNRMISQMDELIRRIGREEAEKKRIEIQALRYQINPHFLFNTLNSIRWLATFDKKDEVVNAVTTLVHLLEGSLQRNGPYVKLGEELDLLEKYIVIQQYRYDSRIRLQIGCAAELRDILVPRMILQPIVENSIFHGIAPKEAEGKIEIACEDLENDLVITIRDDGIGMDQEMIDHLLHRRSDQAVKGMTSIGLRHVHETLQLHYGKSYGLAVTSRKGEGTAVRLHLSKHPGG